MKIIKFTTKKAAEDLEKDFRAELRIVYKAAGRKFRVPDGALINRHKGKEHNSFTYFNFYATDDLNGNHLIHPDNFREWSSGLVQDMVALIPDGQEITDKIYPETDEI